MEAEFAAAGEDSVHYKEKNGLLHFSFDGKDLNRNEIYSNVLQRITHRLICLSFVDCFDLCCRKLFFCMTFSALTLAMEEICLI